MSSILGIPQSGNDPLRNVAEPTAMKSVTETPILPRTLFYFNVRRTKELFLWLRNVSNASMDASQSRPSQRYVSKVKILDQQKAYLVINNTIPLPDGMHETCHVRLVASRKKPSPNAWLIGLAKREPSGTLNAKASSVRKCTHEVVRCPIVGEITFRTSDGCGNFGSLFSITALLADILLDSTK
jgi:hypothetical protein